MKDIILLHGAIGSKKQLIPLSEKLKEAYTVHLIDFSGHGGNPLPDKFTIDLFVSDLKKYLEEQNITEVYIFAYSMGGFVALKFMESHPDFPVKLITLGTKWSWSPEIAAKEIKMIQPAVISEKLPAFAVYQSKIHAPQNWEEVMLKTQDLMIDLGSNNTFNHQSLAKLKQSILMLRGELDQMVTKEETLEMVSNLANADYLEIKNTPHPIEKVDCEVLYSNIVAFLIP